MAVVLSVFPSPTAPKLIGLQTVVEATVPLSVQEVARAAQLAKPRRRSATNDDHLCPRVLPISLSLTLAPPQVTMLGSEYAEIEYET
jgi:hypothetical protein